MRFSTSLNIICLSTVLLMGHISKAQTSPSTESHAQPTTTKLSGFNIKLSPAIFWKTVVLEFEYPVNKTFTVGLNLLGKIGRTDAARANAILNDENLLNNGLRAELAVKYFIKKEAPMGFYVQSNLAWGNLIYFDGNVRPYTLHNHWKKPTPENPVGKLERPFPISAGIGGGYQLVMLPKHIIANLMLGVQGNMDQQKNFFVSLYVAPSLGYMF